MVRGDGPASELAALALVDESVRGPAKSWAPGAGEAPNWEELGLGSRPREFEITLGPRRPARFSVLGPAGALISGALGRFPFQMKLGKTPNGEMVAGFGGMALRKRPEGRQAWLGAAAEPLRIYIGDYVVYEKRNVWLFGLASDGSSHFSIEPLGDDSSVLAGDLSARLMISNHNHGTEAHHDLGSMLADSEGFLTHVASYTPDNQEVHLEPLPVRTLDRGMGTHYFYDTAGEAPPREIQVPDHGRYDVAHFTSSELGYFFFEAANAADTLHIVKGRFTWGSDGGRPELVNSESVWRKAGPVNTRADDVAISLDGARLLFGTGTANTGYGSRQGDWGLYLLDTATGDIVFHLPTRDTGAQISRLSNVLPAQPADEDVGRYMGAFFAGNDKLAVRRLKYADNVIDFTSPVYDVYDLNSITMDAQPEYRFEGNEHQENECASRGFPGTLRAAEDGRLAYAPLK